MQLKYSNYVAFSHFHGKAVNNSGLLYILFLHICFLYLSAGNFFLICCYLREIILDFIIFGKDNYR